MTLPDVTPTRKQRFDAAVKLSGLSLDRWLEEYAGGISRTHLYLVLTEERKGGAELNAAIDELIEKYLGQAA